MCCRSSAVNQVLPLGWRSSSPTFRPSGELGPVTFTFAQKILPLALPGNKTQSAIVPILCVLVFFFHSPVQTAFPRMEKKKNSRDLLCDSAGVKGDTN